MRRYEIRTSTVAETTDEQIKALAANFYPTIRAYYDTEEDVRGIHGRAECGG